jgi:hypothetical protein
MKLCYSIAFDDSLLKCINHRLIRNNLLQGLPFLKQRVANWGSDKLCKNGLAFHALVRGVSKFRLTLKFAKFLGKWV